MYEEILFYPHVNYILFASILGISILAGLGTRYFKKSGQLKAD